jgi:hypothetical protein
MSFVFLLTFLLNSQVNLNGYYEGEFVSEKLRRPFSWGMWNPKNYFELKISAKPYPGIESYISLGATSNSNGERLFFNQGHLTARKGNIEFNFFSREDRYWIESPLLYLVNTDRVKDDAWGPKGEGFRLDFWDLEGYSGTFITSKYRTWDGEAYIARLDKSIGDIISFGGVYLKKDWRGGVPPTYNEVKGIHWRLKIYRTLFLRFEGANSIHPAQKTPTKLDNSAYEIELRSLRIGNLLIAGSYFDYGLDFIDEFSNKFNQSFDHEFDRRGIYGEFIYLLPGRAINLIYKTKRFKTRYQHPRVLDKPFRTIWNYGEIYVEFVGGLNAKAVYETWREREDLWKHFLIEALGENKVMRIKLQYKIKDIGVNRRGRKIEYSVGERHIVGIELRVNLSGPLQFYGRGAFGMGVAKNWESLFLQLVYRGFQNTEIYFEYGEPSHTDGDLVNDPDIADYIYQKIVDRFKILVKFWF